MKKTLILLSLFLAPAAFAQDSASDRIDQLERQVLLLQTKLDRSGGAASSSDTPADASGGVAGAQTDVRLSSMEEELRGLRGKLEEKEFENRRISEEFDKFKRDTEFRLGELEKHSVPTATLTPTESKAPEAPPAPAAAEKKTPEKKPSDKEIKQKMEVSVKEETTEPKPETPAADNVEGPKGFDTPRDHYNYAFRQLNQNQYDEAAKNFASFTKKYPKDPLVGNAYYWLGETHYIHKDFAAAADQFRQGFEAMPKGPKAGDNLLKLGMSLAALQKNEEACVVLSQVMTKFKTTNAKVAAKAEAEHTRVPCE